MIEADHLSVTGLEDFRSRHVDLRYGIIEPGLVRDDLRDFDPAEQRLELERRYGVLLGCHVIVDEQEAVQVPKTKFPWHTGGLRSDGHKKALVDAVEADRTARPSGLPKKGDGAIEVIVQHELANRLKGGLVQADSEFVAYEPISWIEKIGGYMLEAAQTTMRDYLAPLLKGRTTDDAKQFPSLSRVPSTPAPVHLRQ